MHTNEFDISTDPQMMNKKVWAQNEKLISWAAESDHWLRPPS